MSPKIVAPMGLPKIAQYLGESVPVIDLNTLKAGDEVLYLTKAVVTPSGERVREIRRGQVSSRGTTLVGTRVWLTAQEGSFGLEAIRAKMVTP